MNRAERERVEAQARVEAKREIRKQFRDAEAKLGPFVITIRDVQRCPKMSLSPRHFRTDGSCRCDAEGQAEKAKLDVMIATCDALKGELVRYRDARAY